MTVKLNQIIAIEKGTKSQNYSKIDAIHKAAQKPDLFNGMTRNYEALDSEDKETFAPEIKRVQLKATDALAAVEKLTTEMLDITARKDWTNTRASGDIKVEGVTLLHSVPVTYLLFLEKQLTDLRTFVDSIVVLDTSEEWRQDHNDGLWKTQRDQKHRTKKVQKALMLVPPTDKHPGQAVQITEDITVGHWHTVKMSGAIPLNKKMEMNERITKLLNAVKQAREAANGQEEIDTPKVGKAIFDYLFERNP